MSSIMPIMTATGSSFDSANTMFNAYEGRTALANRVTGNESPAEVASIAAQDKALALQAAHAEIQYQVAQAQLAAAQERKRKEAARHNAG